MDLTACLHNAPKTRTINVNKKRPEKENESARLLRMSGVVRASSLSGYISQLRAPKQKLSPLPPVVNNLGTGMAEDIGDKG